MNSSRDPTDSDQITRPQWHAWMATVISEAEQDAASKLMIDVGSVNFVGKDDLRSLLTKTSYGVGTFLKRMKKSTLYRVPRYHTSEQAIRSTTHGQKGGQTVLTSVCNSRLSLRRRT